MRHVVLDTNALIQALPTRSIYHKIWSEFLAGKYCMCVSNEILTEYEEILANIVEPMRSLPKFLYSLELPQMVFRNKFFLA